MRMLTLLPLPARRATPFAAPAPAAGAGPRHQAPEPPNASAASSTPPAEEDAPPRTCGWFDSSHELQQGLQLTVHDGSAELATLVPLGWWLQWELEAAAQHHWR